MSVAVPPSLFSHAVHALSRAGIAVAASTAPKILYQPTGDHWDDDFCSALSEALEIHSLESVDAPG